MRIRFRYRKNKSIRYTSTLDVQLIWERACRRAALPIAYSQGYHPQARIQQALPLPLGFTSECEIVDIWFEHEIVLTEIKNNLADLKLLGIEITDLENIPDHAPSLQKDIVSCEYSILPVNKTPSDLELRIEEFLSQKSIQGIRNGKSYNLRMLVFSLIWENMPSPKISMLLSARSGATARPEEVLASLGLDPFDFLFVRTRIVIGI
jgi:radical SAM-linked protein